MGHIKSALEIALEKTADIAVDKTAIDSRDLKNRGKKGASEFLSALASIAAARSAAAEKSNADEPAAAAAENAAETERPAVDSNAADTGEQTAKAAAKFLEALKEADAERMRLVAEGAASIFIASLNLPSSEDDITRFQSTGIGLELLLPGAGMGQLFEQLAQILEQYLQERGQTEQAMQQQYLPRLRAKQQEMAKRYGQNMPLDPRQHPEFMAALNKNMRMVEQRYEPVLEEVRSRIREAVGMEEN